MFCHFLDIYIYTFVHTVQQYKKKKKPELKTQQEWVSTMVND